MPDAPAAADAGVGERVLQAVARLLDPAYAQWLVEDPDTLAYRVVSARLPPGERGYATAHRLGVIGQVFRARRAILVLDTRAHPLYDAYDAAVDWELALPVFEHGRLVAVLNLEGRRPAPDFDVVWGRLTAAVDGAMGGTLAATPPRADDDGLRPTVWVRIEAAAHDVQAASADLARVLAGAGRSVLVVTAGANATDDDIEAALSGLAPGIDRLQVPPPDVAAVPPIAWRTKLAGRYDFVLSAPAARVLYAPGSRLG